MTSINDLTTGSKSHQFDQEPKITGLVTKVEEKPQTDFDTGEPLKWPDGNFRTQWVFTLQIHAGTEDDDGLRNIYAKGGNFKVGEGTGKAMLPAIVEAYRKAGIKEMEGAQLTVERTGYGERQRGKQPASLYTAVAEPGRTPVAAVTRANDNPF
jgi:hypothetical protein